MMATATAPLVFVYPEKTREPLGAERYLCEWYQVKASATRRNRMREVYAKNRHVREKHPGEFSKCMLKGCEYYHYTDLDPDSDMECRGKVFRGDNAKEKAMAWAQSEINTTTKNAYGSIMVYRQVVDWYVEEDRIAEWVTVGDGEDVTANVSKLPDVALI